MATVPQLFAHSGAKSVAPDNTLPAFQAALDMRADGIELDVQCSKDGVLVVLHDYAVDALTDGHGAVDELTLEELQSLDAGSRFSPAFAGVRIPTLVEVLDLAGDRCLFNIEIKAYEHDGGDEGEALIDLIRRRNLFDQVIISSFNPVSLIKLRATEPRIALGLLYHQPLPAYLLDAWLGPIMAPEALHPHNSLVDAAYMAWAKERGKAVNVWTVNDPDEARRLQALGVDIIITDAPDVLRAALSTEGAIA
ncbi:MAG: glycerophosphodiester phosphodiesterase family protein [Chloroflexota bacterium]|jgi:glycerophosphoryl diester phosphodiesterase|nr:glycerophosphodiester phosphodiesterase family protein [Chloroflexota bacterium]